MLKAAVSLFCILALPALSMAALVNGDIENNVSNQFGAIAGWGPNGGWAPHSGFAKPGNETLGANFGFMSAGGTETVGQKAAETFLPAVQYTFSCWAWPGGDNLGEIVFQIGYDNAGTFEPLATQAYNIDNATAWAALPGVSHTPKEGSPELGKTIWVRLGDGVAGEPGRSDVWFDNLTLVPEPASLLLIGLAAAGLIRRR